MQGKVVVHSISPYAMCWTSNHIVVGGSDKKIVFYGHEGSVAQQFDYFREPSEKEFTVMCCSPSGQAVAVGSFDRIRVYRWAWLNKKKDNTEFVFARRAAFQLECSQEPVG